MSSVETVIKWGKDRLLTYSEDMVSILKSPKTFFENKNESDLKVAIQFAFVTVLLVFMVEYALMNLKGIAIDNKSILRPCKKFCVNLILIQRVVKVTITLL
ncbi:hypothetical protein [Aliikangiella maris]|uniref:Uncharacterized protein n=2 Tax=Aliikangiella maris TaxID=3162458 RepID=A0ABV3MQ72_9GAMM